MTVRNRGNAPLGIEGQIQFLRPDATDPVATIEIPRGTLLTEPTVEGDFAAALPAGDRAAVGQIPRPRRARHRHDPGHRRGTGDRRFAHRSRRMVPFAEGLLWLMCCPGLGAVTAAEPAAPVLRTFVVDKPASSHGERAVATDSIHARRGDRAAAKSRTPARRRGCRICAARRLGNRSARLRRDRPAERAGRQSVHVRSPGTVVRSRHGRAAACRPALAG